MRVWIVGSTGGREQALAWACRRFGHDVSFEHTLPSEPARADLVIVGPEVALAAGVADQCATRGIPCFGPTAALARLESSKSYARDVARALHIPGPAYATFMPGDVDGAINWWRARGHTVVVKQSGLAAGKGVFVPADDDETIEAIRYVSITDEFVLEERLSGAECSLIALCDGSTARALPIAQDHKRIGEGDTGPNTGGMGAYAPAPVPYSADSLVAQFIQPVIDHFAAAGTPYVGALYAGLMLTADGPRLLEWNCRFGDPEAQTILPLLDGDLAELALACTAGRLAATPLHVRSGATCTVVAASAGYPTSAGAPAVIHGLGGLAANDNALLFSAGMSVDGDVATATGGRVLAITGIGADLGDARANAYDALAGISFAGMQVRRDIAWRARGAVTASYASAGVDIAEGNRAVSLMKDAVQRTHTPAVLSGVGAFGGALDISALKAFDHPVLVASTDGVGTKVELAARAGRPGGAGHDIVNHCINDVLVQGAVPLFFLDYIASAHLDSELVAAVVSGMAQACEASGCVLLGGETAEMPGVYEPGAFDVAGTLVGVVERDHMLPKPTVGVGDVLIGMASVSPHTNGYSLLRRIFQWIPLDAQPAPLNEPLGDALLRPHRSYLAPLAATLAQGNVKALAHITGGGLIENTPRVLPEGCRAQIQLGSWPELPLFQLVRSVAPLLDEEELHRSLNMGIGMVLVVAPELVESVRASIEEETWVIGSIIAGERGTTLVARA